MVYRRRFIWPGPAGAPSCLSVPGSVGTLLVRPPPAFARSGGTWRRCRSRSKRWRCGTGSPPLSATIAASTPTARSASPKLTTSGRICSSARHECGRSAMHTRSWSMPPSWGPLGPALSPLCIGALAPRRDGAADPHRTIAAFRRTCEAVGVTFIEGCGLEAVERDGWDWLLCSGTRRFVAPVVVNAGGAWAGKLAALFGDEIELGLKASMMIVTERLAPLLGPVISVVGRALSFKQSDQGTLVIGGGLQ